jgi:predicted PurR-regulated permease PerM
MEFTPTQKRAATWIAIGVLAVLVLRLLGPVLTPFVVGAVLAYALTPLVDRLDEAGRGRVPRVVSVIVVELAFVLALVSLFLLVVPILAQEMPLMRQQLPVLFEKLDANLRPWLAQFGIHVAFDVESLKTQAMRYLQGNYDDYAARLMASLKVGGSFVFTLAFNALLIPVALFYLLLDWDRFVHRVLELVPPHTRPAVDSFTHEADQVLGQYLRGQLLVMLTMATFYSLGLGAFGLDLALPIGIFTGLAMFVPYLGFGIGLALALLAGLLQFASAKAFIMVAVVYGTGQIVEGFYFTPRLVGKRIGLHPLAVIFALLAFAQVFGFLGVLVALPASAVLLVAIRRVRDGYMGSKLYQGG